MDSVEGFADIAVSEPAPPNAAPPSITRRWLVALVLSLLIAAGFAYLLHLGALPVVPPREAFAHVAWWTVGAYSLIWLTALLVRSYRWKWLLEPIAPVTTSRLMSVSLISMGALVVLPLRMGEVVRPTMIRGPKLSAWAATGTVAAERVIDGLVICLLLFAGLLVAQPLDPLPDHIGDLRIPVALVPRGTYIALGLFAVAFLLMALFYFGRERVRRAVLRVLGSVSPRLSAWVAAKVDGVATGLSFLPRARSVSPFVAATVLYWWLNAAGVWLISRGADIPLTLPQSMVLVGVLALGVLVPNAPGYFGTFQLSLYAGFAMYKAPGLVVERASVVIFLIYLVQILGTLLLAAVGLWWFQRASRSESHAERASA